MLRTHPSAQENDGSKIFWRIQTYITNSYIKMKIPLQIKSKFNPKPRHSHQTTQKLS